MFLNHQDWKKEKEILLGQPEKSNVNTDKRKRLDTDKEKEEHLKKKESELEEMKQARKKRKIEKKDLEQKLKVIKNSHCLRL